MTADPGPYGRIGCIVPNCRRTYKRRNPIEGQVICGRCFKSVEPRYRQTFKGGWAGYRRSRTKTLKAALMRAAGGDRRRLALARQVIEAAYIAQINTAFRRLVAEATILRAMGVG